MKNLICRLLVFGVSSCGLLCGCSEEGIPRTEHTPQFTRSQFEEEAERADSVPNAFLYLEGERIPLHIDTTREVLITDSQEPLEIPSDSLFGTFRQGELTGYVLERGTSFHFAAPEQIVTVEDILTDGTPFFPEFLAVVKDIREIDQVKAAAAELECEVKYQLESDPTFIKMTLLPGAGRKVLDVSHRLYETGLFLSVDPGLIPIIKEGEPMPETTVFSVGRTYDQWNLGSSNGANAMAAWKYTKGSPDITLAVLDCRFNPMDYAELKGHMHPYSYTPYADNSIHGAQCASVAAGDGTSSGYWGVAPGVKVMLIGMKPADDNVPNYTEGFLADALVNGINNARNNGADVMNCSWLYGYTNTLPSVVTAFKNAMTYGRSGKGCVVVFAAGNKGVIEQPAKSLADAIVVGATDRNGNVCDFSGKGNELDIVAPGKEILLPATSGYAIDKGTSYAAPHVAGTAALILSMRPDLTQKEVSQVILSHTSGHRTPSTSYGQGTVDAYRALKALNGDGISLELPYEVQNGTITLDQAFYYFALTGAPNGSVSKLDIPGGRFDENSGMYNMSGISSPQTITVTGTVDYMHRRFTVTKSLKVVPVKPVIRSIGIITPPGGNMDSNSFDVFVDCNNWGAQITWEVSNQYGAQYTVEDPFYSQDAGFYDKPGFVKTIKASNDNPEARCSIDVTVIIPGLGGDRYSVNVFGTGENARIELM